MPKVKFIIDTKPEDGPLHTKGEVLEVSPDSLDFWLARQAIEVIDAGTAPAPEPEPEPEPEADEPEPRHKGKGRR
jgi:hypothetical protein